MEDKMIVELYWQRDESAISVTAAKYGRYCNTIANNILHNSCDAEECVNDTYIAAWNSMPDNRPEKLRHYLGKMTRWIALNRLDMMKSQKRGGNVQVLPIDELIDYSASDCSTQAAVELQEMSMAINCFLSGLKPVDRQIFLARYWFALPIAEISEKFGFTQSKVKSILFRTRKKLKIYLEEEGLC
ncbi:MAG: sigma-70 family RNA polymerase sigma factor [Oscillospiraceae bacterium]|nr:sigma-70 family RNA polymerase sigma factor [Oscillospiraceae bacterium]